MPEKNPSSLKLAWPAATQKIYDQITKIEPRGIFATGIENSDPFVDGLRRNQLVEAYNFPENFDRRLRNIKELGLKWLRFGVGYSLAHPEPGCYDFGLLDKVIARCDELGINVILDLLHFGLPEWLHFDNPEKPFFQNELFPVHFAAYAREVAKRYPQIKYFTPVNEPLVTARFSAKDGVWNEKIATEWWDHRPYVRALANIAKAAILAKQAILQVWEEEKRAGEPLFFQNESFEFTVASSSSDREWEARGFNAQRFASTDLIFGHRDELIRRYLVDEQGLPAEEYEWFMKMGNVDHMVLGIDYYPWSVFQLGPENSHFPHDPYLAEALMILIPDYYDRYQLPLLHMELNATPDRAVAMCQNTYDCLAKLRQLGYPILGMSWFGDDMQVGWQTQLRGEHGFDEFRVGLFYKGQAEPVAKLFSKLAKQGF